MKKDYWTRANWDKPPSAFSYARPYSIHGTPAEQDAYRARVQALDKGREQTCPGCDATNSHLLRFINGAAFYHCEACGLNFYG